MKATPRTSQRHPWPQPTRLGLAVALAFGAAPAALALPTGEQVVSGQVAVGRPNAQSMVVQQGSASAILNWNSFSIGAGEGVSFQQPSAASVILNRVVQQNASEIAGRLSANGRVFLVNPSGVLFARGASVDVGALVASTLDISNSDFLAGRYQFAGPGPGTVVNQGTLQAAERGAVVLLGGQVSNAGTITARLGTVALVSGNKVTLDFAGDGLTRIAVDQAAVGALVANSGMVIADGGQAVLTARAAEALAGTVVNQQGLVQARSLVERNGRIVLDGGDTGTTLVSGRLDVSGRDAGRSGGEIRVLGHHVGLAGAAALDASGESGGGAVLVGGDLRGQNPDVRNAEATFVGPDASIRADALGSGSGGRVIVWSDRATRVYGSISANGGAAGGDGGFVETSGAYLDVAGARGSASSPLGRAGEWLLDPIDVVINTVTSGNVTASPDFTATAVPANVNVADIAAALNGGTSVTVSTGGAVGTGQAGDIVWQASTLAKTAGGDATLRLNAHNDIVLAPGVAIASTSGRLNLAFNSNSDGIGSGAIVLGGANGGVQIATNGGSVLFFGAGDPVAGSAVGAIGQAGISIVNSTIGTAGGAVSMRGRGGAGEVFVVEGTTRVAGGTGVSVVNSTIRSGPGAITIFGTGGDGGVGDPADTVTNGRGTDGGAGVAGLAGTTLASTSGAIAITGAGGAGGAGANSAQAAGAGGDGGHGVDHRWLVQSVTGAVSITGSGGAAGAGGDGANGGIGGFAGDGINAFGGSVLNGSGSVSLFGVGGLGSPQSLSAGAPAPGTEGFNGTGVALGPGTNGGPTIGTGSGDILVFGSGTNPFDNRFVTGLRLDGATVLTTAGGNIDLRGRADSPSTGFTSIGFDMLNSTVSTSGGPGRILISGETTTDSPGVRIANDQGAFAATVGGATTTGDIVIRALNDGGRDAIELRDVIRTSGLVNLRPGGVAANGSLTAADGVPIYIAEPAFAGETALGPFGFVLDAADLANIQDGSAGIVIGGSTHVGRILVSLDFPWLDNLTLQNGGAGSGGILIGAAIGDPGNLVTLSSGGRVTQSAPISASSLLLHGTRPESSFQLDLPSNSVGTLAARFELPKSLADPSYGDVNFVNAGALAIGPLAGTGFDSAGDLPFAIVAANSTSGGDFFARNLAGNLTLNHGIATLGSDITLVTAGILDNAGGGTLAPAAGGVWRVWADTWVGETRGGLDPGNARPNFYGCTYPGACVSDVSIPAAGNHFIYRQRPTAIVVALDAARPFGVPNPPLGFRVTGLVNGDAAADAAAATLGTSATVASPVGTYPITGTTASAVGYVLDFVPATLSVLPNPVPQASTVIEYAQSLLYGRNIGVQSMCLATGPLLVSDAADTPDRLDREWSRVRQLPNLTNCVEVGERHGCKDF